MATNLTEIRLTPHQASCWPVAERVFNWCDWFLPPCNQRLDAKVLQKLAAGQVPQTLLKKMRADLSRNLKETLPWSEHFAVVRRVLRNPKDYAVWMNCPLGKHRKLSKRIRDAVASGEQERSNQLYADFFAKVDDAKMADYVRAWQSRDRASTILISLARGEITLDELDTKTREEGFMTIGRLRLDEKRFVLRSVESLGTLRGRGVAHIISRLAQSGDCPFFIKLGNALARASKTPEKRPQVEWTDGNERARFQAARFLVENWCRQPSDWKMPPLCLLDNGTIALFCSRALGRSQTDKKTTITAIRKWVSRLRLKHV